VTLALALTLTRLASLRQFARELSEEHGELPHHLGLGLGLGLGLEH